jgi:acid phosphatase
MVKCIECVAPTSAPSPLNLTLIAAFLFTRHGARTPIYDWALPNEGGTWRCDSSDARAPRMYSLGTSGIPHRRFHAVYDQSILPLNSGCAYGDRLLEGM